MRRTRHVVLPVRSWEHVGLMMVSLACLTLGVVSRDREGQAGSLAGPDLQHCAPHKVDACPNDNVFTRLPFYDDSATPSGPTNDEPKEHRTTRVLETRESRLTRGSATVRVSRFEPGRTVERRDSSLAERRDDRGSRRTRDSRSLERDSIAERRNLHISERRNDQRRSQQIRLSRSLERDSVNRYSRSLADRTTERRDGRLSERRTDRLRNSERDSSAARKFLATAERRGSRLDERRNTQTQISRSLRREPDSTNSRSLTGRSNERDTSVRAFQRAVEHRDDHQRRQTREVRMTQRDSSARNSRLTSERRDRSTRSLDRATAVTRNAEFLDERRESRLTSDRRSDRVTSLRSVDRDSAARNSRLVTGHREARLSERRDERRNQRARLAPVINRSALIRNSRLAVAQVESERREARVSARRDERREDREIRDARSHQRMNSHVSERDSSARRISLVDERREDRTDRRVRGTRSLDRDSRTRNLDRESRTRDRRSTQRSLHSATERRENRVNDGIRVARSSERDLETREVRLVSENRGDRRVRSLRSTGRDSTLRNVRERFVTRNTERNERYNFERFDSRRSSVTKRRAAENRVDRSTRSRQSTDLRQIRENLMHDGRIERRDVRMMGEKSLRRDRDSRVTRAGNDRDRAYRRSHETRAPAAVRDNETHETRDKRVTRGAGLMFDKIYREQLLPSATKYEGLRETVILILCAVYGASLFGTGKGSISGNIMGHMNRIVVW